MLALGIGANVVVFSLVDSLLLRPLPFPDADRLVYINESAPKWNLEIVGVNYPDFWQWHEHATAFEALAAYTSASINLSDDTGAERVLASAVTRDFFDVLRVSPILGRAFTAEEDRPKGPDVAILSERLWRRRYDADPKVVGRTIRANGVDRTIVGVFPQVAEFPDEAAIWIPMQEDPSSTNESYDGSVIGRLTPGVTVAQADADLKRAHGPIWEKRDHDHVVSPFARDLRQQLSADSRSLLPPIIVAVGLLMVVACANVASVMLARAIARRREVGIRLAIGASRVRLLQQLFAENLLLAGAGGLVGLVAGRLMLSGVVAMLGNAVPRWTQFGFDPRLAAYSIGITVAATLLFGWAPALHALSGDLRSAVGDSIGVTTASRGVRRTLTGLVAAEFALSAMLIAGGGLLYRAFDRLSHVDPGFQADHALTFRLALSDPKYTSADAKRALWEQLVTILAATPGAESVGLVSCPPLDCHWGYFFKAEGAPPARPTDPRPVVLTRVASEGYKDAAGLRLVAGRFLDAHDRQKKDAESVVVNETFARTFFPADADVVGKRVRFEGNDNPWLTIVGVAHDVKHYGLDKPMRPAVYVPMSWARLESLAVVIRTANEPAAFTATARAAVTSLDPRLPMYRVRTLEAAIAESMRTRTVYSALLGIFAILALTLAIGGTYGVTSYLAAERTRELGIRLAVGARPSHLARAVLSTGWRTIPAGIVLGLTLTVFLAHRLGDSLFDVPAFDAPVLLISAGILALAAAAANWLPARRAARTDPVRSLRA
jgi:predicted permease